MSNWHLRRCARLLALSHYVDPSFLGLDIVPWMDHIWSMARTSSVQVSEDIISVSELKAHAAKWLDRAMETDAPLVVTQHGRAAGVLVSPRMYDALVEQGQLALAVGEGLDDANTGRVISHAALKRELADRYGTSATPKISRTSKKR